MISMGFDIQCCAMRVHPSEEVGDTSNIKTFWPGQKTGWNGSERALEAEGPEGAELGALTELGGGRA
jgi:hypothetical protein